MQSRYWCITVNNGPFLDNQAWLSLLDEEKQRAEAGDASQFEAMVAQCEIAPETGRKHVQAFVIYVPRKRFAQVKAMFPGCHIEMMKGTPLEAWLYCEKEESRDPTGWRFSWGERPRPSQAGKRTDLEQIRDLCKENKTWVEIVDIVPGALRYGKEIRLYKAVLSEKQPRDPEPIVLRDWQQELFGLLTGPVVTRRIWWIWSEHSAVGKSTTMRFFMDSYPGTTCMGSRKLSDLMYAFDQDKHRIIWYDMARSDPLDAEMTTVLETISTGGWVLSSKYESIMKRVSAHIVVTSNRPPPNERLPGRCIEYRLNEFGERIVPQIQVANPNEWLNPDFYF